MLRPTIANSADRDRRERIERVRNELTEEHLNPLLLEPRTSEPHAATRELGASTYRELYRPVRLRPRRARGAVPRVPRLDTSRCRRTRRPALPRARRRPLSRSAALGRRRASSAASSGTPRSRRTGCCRRSRRRSPSSASTCARRRTSTSTSRSARARRRARSARRSRCRARSCSSSSRSAGPTTGARSSTRPATPSTSRTRRAELTVEERRLGDNAVTEGWAMLLRAPDGRARLAHAPARLPAADEFASEGAAQLLFFVRRYCAKLLYELEFHARRRPGARCGALRRAARRRAEDRAERRRTTWATSTRASTSRRTCARGPSRRSSAPTCAQEFGNAWFARREAGSLLRELWGEGQRGRPRTCSGTSPARPSSSSRSRSACAST